MLEYCGCGTAVSKLLLTHFFTCFSFVWHFLTWWIDPGRFLKLWLQTENKCYPSIDRDDFLLLSTTQKISCCCTSFFQCIAWFICVTIVCIVNWTESIMLVSVLWSLSAFCRVSRALMEQITGVLGWFADVDLALFPLQTFPVSSRRQFCVTFSAQLTQLSPGNSRDSISTVCS